MGQKQPWHQQPHESAKAYEAFTVYRELGSSRSIKKACRKLGKNTTTVGRWSSTWRWGERVKAWDAHLAEKQFSREEDVHQEIHNTILAAIRRHAGLILEALGDIEGKDIPPEQVDRQISNLVRAWQTFKGVPLATATVSVIQGENIQVNNFDTAARLFLDILEDEPPAVKQRILGKLAARKQARLPPAPGGAPPAGR